MNVHVFEYQLKTLRQLRTAQIITLHSQEIL